jgi:acyl-CoA thioesterase-1
MERRKFIKGNLLVTSLLFLPNWLKAAISKDVPNVLILGDSISIGYTPFVQQQLEGIASVYRPVFENGNNENCQGTTHGLKHIDRWIGTKKWDVIHFNFGLHDLKHVDAITGKNSANKEDPYQANLKQYKKNLTVIVDKLKMTNALLIFATTTPYPDDLKVAIRDPGLSEKYNKIALRVMKKNKIMINDLYSFVLPRMQELQIPKNVHFTKKGSEALGIRVADIIRYRLKI